ncbi:MAG: HAD-IB family hydrolase [Chlamydiales bacterium]|nr:HAD-IB family hydrolase [Chlamydiales bacterium]
MSVGSIDAFDLDHTLIKANASFRFGAYLFRKKVFNVLDLISLLSFYARFKFFGMPVYELHHKAFQTLFKGRLLLQMRTYVDSFLDEHLVELFYPPAIERLRDAQHQDHVTAIFSSSPDFLVEPIAKRLGVHYWGGSSYDVGSTGCFQAVSKVLEGEDKVTLLQRLVEGLGVGLDSVTVYSDSMLDLPFLKAAGKAVAVNPDKELRALSVQQGWEVI